MPFSSVPNALRRGLECPGTVGQKSFRALALAAWLVKVSVMKRAWALICFLLASAGGVIGAPTVDALEPKIRALTEAPQVTIVHFWAPWCSNCKTEMRPDGWAKFVTANPGVKVVFLNIWHKGVAGAPTLFAAGLGTQPNFIPFDHPNGSNARGEKLDQFLGMPIGWVPTTWVYRDGKLRYALNYGEVRFEMLQQMVDDATASW